MQRKVKTLAQKFLDSSNVNITTVPISQCRHYCGFRYGCNSFNPYENYIIGLHQNQPLHFLRRNFEDFLIYYRPQNFADIFNIELSRHIPLWIYPWNNSKNFNPNNGWLDNIDKIVDIMTHFCEIGIKRSHIQREYFWLEQAYALISTIGYQPKHFSYIEVFELTNQDKSVFIVKDGNHRLSALVALGYTEVVVKHYSHEKIKAEDYEKWFQVVLGTYSKHDAQSLFNTYFVGVDSFKRSSQPAKILEC